MTLKRALKEQKDLLANETSRNNKIESKIKEKDEQASKLRNQKKQAMKREEDLKSEVSFLIIFFCNMVAISSLNFYLYFHL